MVIFWFIVDLVADEAHICHSEEARAISPLHRIMAPTEESTRPRWWLALALEPACSALRIRCGTMQCRASTRPQSWSERGRVDSSVGAGEPAPAKIAHASLGMTVRGA
jgi:hypothetical protein